MLRQLAIIGIIAANVWAQTGGIAVAQATTPAASSTGTLTGKIFDQSQHPVAGVAIRLTGPVARTAQSDVNGAFDFDGLPPGLYTLNMTRAGYSPAQETDAVLAASVTTAAPQLAQASLSSISTIGRTSTTARNAINTTTASISTISGESFIQQGAPNVGQILNQIPGVSVGPNNAVGNTGYGGGATALTAGIPSLRGSLPYETSSLIDGHPINLGLHGTFDPAFINPYVLDNVEVVKGPGAQAANINYAIGGTINYRTLEPTVDNKQSADFGIDQFGGQTGNLRATGTLAGKLGYAFDYATDGSQGPDRGYDPVSPNVLLAAGDLVNGQTVCGNPNATGCGIGVDYLANSPIFGGVNFTSPLALCCVNVPEDNSGRNELAKLRYHFSPTTSLTVTYLGAQLRGTGPGLYTLPDYYFTPPPGYTGALPAGYEFPQDEEYNTFYAVNANLYSAELATSVGPVSVDARYYVTSDYSYLDANPPGTTFAGALYGGVPLGNSLTPTVYNGQIGTITYLNGLFGLLETDKLSGGTLQLAMPVGPNFFSLSYDQTHSSTLAYNLGIPAPTADVPPGSGQSFQTFAAHGQFQLMPGLQATLSDYQTLYTDHYSQDFGATFLDSTHAYNAPRLAFSWHPRNDVAVRASTGFSIAPPYISLLTNTALQPNSFAGSYFTVTNNAGDIRPETAFGFDLGADKRFGRDSTVSLDLYQTTLHDQYLNETTLSPGGYTAPADNVYGFAPGNYPLYITQTQNLGHSRYEGVEFAVHRDPAAGFGYKLQGSLQRAYSYDLPPGFYNTAAGVNTTNLGIFPNTNFAGSTNGYTLAPDSIPYSQGYAELNFRGHNGSYFLVGATYFGPNNGYGQPAFGVVNASFQQPLSKNASLLLVTRNLTNAYSSFTQPDFGGVPTPLVNGLVGYSTGSTIGPSTTSLTLRFQF